MRHSSAIGPDDGALLLEVGGNFDNARDATPGNMTADALIATGQPNRIQSFARQALDLMRGRFNEENVGEAPPE